MCSSGVWMSVMPFARLTHGEAALVEDVRVGAAAAESGTSAFVPQRSSAPRGKAHDGSVCRNGSAR